MAAKYCILCALLCVSFFGTACSGDDTTETGTDAGGATDSGNVTQSDMSGGNNGTGSNGTGNNGTGNNGSGGDMGGLADTGSEDDMGAGDMGTEGDAATPECTTDADCDDANPCTDDVCDTDGACTAEPNTAVCDDASDATRDDQCAGGVCSGTMIECIATQCIASSTPNGVDCDVTYEVVNTVCDDGDAATAGDVCDGAGACAGSPIDCTPMQCDETAELVNGVCERTLKAAGTPCDDGDLASRDDQCGPAGVCGGTPILCVPDECEASSTPNGVDCDVVQAPSGATCDDGDPNTGGDVCDAAGACAGTAIACPVGICEASSTPNGVTCDVVFETAGTSCDDGDINTASDDCDGNGTCAGTPITCTPGICEVSSTPNGVDCDVVFEASGTVCDDASLATRDDVCDGAGACDGTPIVCESGDCVVSSIPNGVDCDTVYVSSGTTCNDFNLSTRNDICDGAGGCAGDPYTCPSPGFCELSNNPNGVDCTLVLLPDGSNCSDNETCTVNDQCVGGQCVGTSLCGNGTCDAICGENAGTCSTDCLTTVGQCDPGENACTNWDDCHSTTTGTGLCANIGCGVGQVGNCFCDPTCIEFGDCCQDMQNVCGCL